MAGCSCWNNVADSLIAAKAAAVDTCDDQAVCRWLKSCALLLRRPRLQIQVSLSLPPPPSWQMAHVHASNATDRTPDLCPALCSALCCQSLSSPAACHLILKARACAEDSGEEGGDDSESCECGDNLEHVLGVSSSLEADLAAATGNLPAFSGNSGRSSPSSQAMAAMLTAAHERRWA